MLSELKSLWDDHMGGIKAAQYRIKLSLEASRPIHSAPHRPAPKAREFEKNGITKMLDLEVIELVRIDWASPFVVAPNKDGMIRFCVDYRKLDAETVQDSYSIPRLEDCINSLRDTKFLLTLEANSSL